MKKLILSTVIGLSLFGFTNHSEASTSNTLYVTGECVHSVESYCSDHLTKHLESNQATLFFMYTDEEGGLTFIDPLYEEFNIIYIQQEDVGELGINLDNLYSGKRYTATFADSELLDLVGIQEYFNRKKPSKELTFASN